MTRAPARGPSLAVSIAALALGGCGFLLDFDDFDQAPAETDAGVDAGPDASVPPEDGGVDGGNDGGPPPLGRAEYQAQLAETLCRRAVFCEPKGGFGELLLQLVCTPGLVSSPLALEEPLVRELLFGTSLFGTPRAELRQAAARACLAAIDSESCAILSRPLPTTCQTAWMGTAAEGEPCLVNAECAGGRCEPLATDLEAICGGVCRPFVASGGRCGEDAECRPGLVCRDGACGTPGAAGDACDANYDCGFELWCDPGTGRCAPEPGQGDACRRRFFGEDPCSARLVCTTEGTVSRCALGAGEGDACDTSTPCRPGLRCDDDAAECVPTAEPGERCAGAGNCPLGLECVDRDGFRCVPRGVIGDACSPSLPCLAGGCDAGRCALVADGEPCDAGADGLRQCEGWCDTSPADGAICRAPFDDGASCASSRTCERGSYCASTDTRSLCRPCP